MPINFAPPIGFCTPLNGIKVLGIPFKISFPLFHLLLKRPWMGYLCDFWDPFYVFYLNVILFSPLFSPIIGILHHKFIGFTGSFQIHAKSIIL